MSRISALVLAVGVAAAVWIVLPIVRPEISAAIWFTGQDGFSGITIYGREGAALIAGLAIWILSLHFPDRPKPIIFRHSAEAAT